MKKKLHDQYYAVREWFAAAFEPIPQMDAIFLAMLVLGAGLLVLFSTFLIGPLTQPQQVAPLHVVQNQRIMVIPHAPPSTKHRAEYDSQMTLHITPHGSQHIQHNPYAYQYATPVHQAPHLVQAESDPIARFGRPHNATSPQAVAQQYHWSGEADAATPAE